MAYDFLNIGGATEDVIFSTTEALLIDNRSDLLRQKLLAFEHGAKINVEKSYSCFGGGAANTAVNLAKIGFRTACLANVGLDDRGRRVVANLKQNKVGVKTVSYDPKNQTGFSFIINNNQDRVIFSCRGANEHLKITLERKPDLSRSDWIYLASLPAESDQLLKVVFANKKHIAWNPGLNQLKAGAGRIGRYLKQCDILILNRDEALELIKKTPTLKYSDRSLSNCRRLLEILKSFGPGRIILTDGLRGAYFYDGLNYYYQNVIRRFREVDTTGVGDAFGSTTVGLWLKTGGDFKKAMWWGMKNAASLVTKFGAQNGLLSLKHI